METYTVITDSLGTVRYYKPNTTILHRIDGPAVEWADGSKSYYVDDKLHRIDGIAVEYADGFKAYWVDDKLHRLDGPAVEYADGNKEYWVDGVYFPEDEFNAKFMYSLNGKIVEIDGKQYRLTAA